MPQNCQEEEETGSMREEKKRKMLRFNSVENTEFSLSANYYLALLCARCSLISVHLHCKIKMGLKVQ